MDNSDHVIVKVADGHNGSIPSGILIAIDRKNVRFGNDWMKDALSFVNPVDGGWSFGNFVAFVNIND